MPFRSVKQAAFIHAKAGEGVPWAKRFVADAHGTHVLHHSKLTSKAKHSKLARLKSEEIGEVGRDRERGE